MVDGFHHERAASRASSRHPCGPSRFNTHPAVRRSRALSCDAHDLPSFLLPLFLHRRPPGAFPAVIVMSRGPERPRWAGSPKTKEKNHVQDHHALRTASPERQPAPRPCSMRSAGSFTAPPRHEGAPRGPCQPGEHPACHGAAPGRPAPEAAGLLGGIPAAKPVRKDRLFSCPVSREVGARMGSGSTLASLSP